MLTVTHLIMAANPDPKFIKAFADPVLLQSYVAGYISYHSNAAIRQHGKFVMALSGGSMPKMLAALVTQNDILWDHIYVLFASKLT